MFGRHMFGPTLVLRRFKVNDTPSTDVAVDIAGRAPGVVAWLLTIMGFDAETTLKTTNKEVSFKSSSLFGQTNHVVPLQMVSSTHCGYSMPVQYLIIGALFLIGGIYSSIGYNTNGWETTLLLLIGIVFLVAYWLSKKLVIYIETSGGMVLGLSFKRSIVENVSVDLEQALKAIGIVNQKVLEAQIK